MGVGRKVFVIVGINMMEDMSLCVGVLMTDGVLVATRGTALAIPMGIDNPERQASTHPIEIIC